MYEKVNGFAKFKAVTTIFSKKMEKQFKMPKNDKSKLEIFRCNIAERWTVEEMAKFILNVREIYNLNIVINSIHEKLTS